MSERNTHQGPPNTNTNTTEGLTHGDTRVGSINATRCRTGPLNMVLFVSGFFVCRERTKRCDY